MWKLIYFIIYNPINMNNITKKIALVSLLLLLASCGNTAVEDEWIEDNLNDTWIEYNDEAWEDFIIEEEIDTEMDTTIEEDTSGMVDGSVDINEEDASASGEVDGSADVDMTENGSGEVDGSVDLNLEAN